MNNNANTAKTNNTDIKDKTKNFLASKGIDIDNIQPSNTYNFSRILGNKLSIKGVNNILDALHIRELIDLNTFNSLKFEFLNANKNIEDFLVEKSIINWDEIAILYSEMRGIPFIDLSNLEIPIEILNKLPKEVAESCNSIIFKDTKDAVSIAMFDPLDLQKIKYIESIVGKKVKPYYGSLSRIKNIINSSYGAQIAKEVDQALAEFGSLVDLDEKFSSESFDNVNLNNAPIIKIINMILDYGINHNSSDIHIEPRENKISVRFRLNGLLSEKLVIPKTLLSALITRIKILCNARIDEHRIPQDGRFQVKSDNYIVDIRVSIIPIVYGEKVVMRLLPKTQKIKDLKDLGLYGKQLQNLQEALKKTQGIILVTGPTGSGKTQTLSSCLKILNTPNVNILTLEDPVEIKIDGINQVQVNPEVGLTFANGLRAFLRQDPDIIMVGEIRDSDTAQLAVQAALVGRLVLSTIHTNSASSTFIRLIDMGIEPFLLTSTINLIIAQRLVRVLCSCKLSYEANDNQLQQLHEILDPISPFTLYNQKGEEIIQFEKSTIKLNLHKPVGCRKCNNTGFIGRTGIFEVLKMSENISKLVLQKASSEEIEKEAIKEGMIKLEQDGFIKVLKGITTIEEVLRVKTE